MPSEARWGAGGKLPAARKLLLLHGSSEVKSDIANTSISAPKGLSIIGWCTHDHYSKDHWLRWSVNWGKSCLLRLVVWKATSGRALLLTLPSSCNLHHHDSLHHQEIRLGSDTKFTKFKETLHLNASRRVSGILGAVHQVQRDTVCLAATLFIRRTHNLWLAAIHSWAVQQVARPNAFSPEWDHVEHIAESAHVF